MAMEEYAKQFKESNTNINNFSELQHEIQEWSDKQFGMYRSPIPMLFHLKKEVDELIEILQEYSKGVYSGANETESDFIKRYNDIVHKIKLEYADCFMLLMDSAAHFPFTMSVIKKSIAEKLEINKNRKWGTEDENGVIEHIK